MANPDLWDMSAKAIAHQISARQSEAALAGQAAVEMTVTQSSSVDPWQVTPEDGETAD